MFKIAFLLMSAASFKLGFSAEVRLQGETWRFEKCRLSVHRLKATKPRAPKFIFINGVPVTSLIYDELATKINKHLGSEVELVDLPGTGLSRNSSYTWSASERCIHAYLKSQQKNFVLVVHDIAGSVALPTLADKSIRFKGAVILNTILSPENFEPVFPLSLIRTPVLGAIVSPLVPFFYFESEMRNKGIARNKNIPKEQIKRIYDDFSYSFGKIRLHRVMRGFELETRRDQRVGLGLETSLPKLTIWGLSDPSLGSQFKYVSRIKNNQVVKLHSAKHFLMLDYADEIFASIKTFVGEL